jgi:hypothetical protein
MLIRGKSIYMITPKRYYEEVASGVRLCIRIPSESAGRYLTKVLDATSVILFSSTDPLRRGLACQVAVAGIEHLESVPFARLEIKNVGPADPDESQYFAFIPLASTSYLETYETLGNDITRIIH